MTNHKSGAIPHSNNTIPPIQDEAVGSHPAVGSGSAASSGSANGHPAGVNLDASFQSLTAELKVKYEVRDILLPSSTLIFILESPHVQELEFGAPVSGASGITMTRHLFGSDYAKFALGRLVKKNADEGKNRPRLNRIGLVNVSNIPLQASAYRDKALISRHQEWFDAMSVVRSENQRDVYSNPYCEAVQSALVCSLRDKLARLTDYPLTIVPCGRFAQKFVRLTQVESPNWTVIHEVPHPSYNSWDRARYRPVIDAVCSAL
ncbi:hypothetical protein JZ785_14660 [Alicyclobacillus curvatus]|nr:hypothetical protein JZ785_14660 [Alicyclobacillus curvatus]